MGDEERLCIRSALLNDFSARSNNCFGIWADNAQKQGSENEYAARTEILRTKGASNNYPQSNEQLLHPMVELPVFRKEKTCKMLYKNLELFEKDFNYIYFRLWNMYRSCMNVE